MIELLRPTVEMQCAVEEFKKEFFDRCEFVIDGGCYLDAIEDYSDWLDFIKKISDPSTVRDGMSTADVYLAFNGEGEIVGIIDLRHDMFGRLSDFGNVGYSVRPTERKKGYATQMVAKIKDRARELKMESIFISCHTDNVASTRVIIKNGGKQRRTFLYKDRVANVFEIKL